MMYSLHVVVKSDDFPAPYDKLSVPFLAFSSFGLFGIMSSGASSVAEAASEIAAKAWIMPQGNACFNQLRFIMFVEKEINLTLWGITPIRKKFIFGMWGAIFTYTLMFYSLNIDKHVKSG
ncbi:hypothetical protein TNCV_1971941 [Trichonephila clavipes]|nr:hypothetical protein TNCV_1971941 [Trichonephila clavipes]